MLTIALMIAFGLAQSGKALHVIVLTNGEKLYGYADARDLESDDLASRIVKVRLDAPWSETVREEAVKGYEIRHSYVPTAVEIEQYHTEEWRKRGGIQIDTPQGKRWVFESEKLLADRAAAMAKANEEKYLELIRVESGGTDAAEAEPADTPGVGQLWGAHVAVVTVGLGLGALAVWFLILQ